MAASQGWDRNVRHDAAQVPAPVGLIEAHDRLHDVPAPARRPLLAVLADVVFLPGPPATLRFFGPGTPTYQSFTAGETPADELEVLGVTDTHTVRLRVGRHPGDLAVRAASVVQDDVMDQLGAPWPQLAPEDGGPPVVLEPVVAEDGSARWVGGDYTCPVGELRRRLGDSIRPT